MPNTANALRQFLSPILASELAKIEVGGRETNAQLVCRALVKKAKTGDTAACKMIFDLLEDTAKNTKSFLRKPPPLYIPDNLEELSPAELQDLYLQTV